jgi:septin 7
LGSAVSGADERLKPIDIEFMRRLHQKVNLIPVIAKADTLTEEEVSLFKQRVSSYAHTA